MVCTLFILGCISFFSHLKLIFRLWRSGLSLKTIRDYVMFQKALEDLHRADCLFNEYIKQYFDSFPRSTFSLEHRSFDVIKEK